jgi:hypothetical protein
MAVIGPSKKRNYFFLFNHQENFKGNLYAVHPTVKEIPNFPKENIISSIKDLPSWYFDPEYSILKYLGTLIFAKNFS